MRKLTRNAPFCLTIGILPSTLSFAAATHKLTGMIISTLSKAWLGLSAKLFTIVSCKTSNKSIPMNRKIVLERECIKGSQNVTYRFDKKFMTTCNIMLFPRHVDAEHRSGEHLA